jgi:hypothetical protein
MSDRGTTALLPSQAPARGHQLPKGILAEAVPTQRQFDVKGMEEGHMQC